MKDAPFFKFDAGAWLLGKIQLFGTAEKGIFIDLLAHIWHENGCIKNDNILHRILRVEKATLSDALKAFLEIEIMYEKDGFLRIKFVDEQLSSIQQYRAKQAAFGAKGGRPKKGTKAIEKGERRNKKGDKDNTPLAPSGGDDELPFCADSEKPKVKFIKPTPAEVQAYCDERSNGISGQEFCDHYEANGWKVGRNAMKNWQAAVRTWERTRRGTPQNRDHRGI